MANKKIAMSKCSDVLWKPRGGECNLYNVV